jgi:hypoxanthine phosphoribosyltransferase
MDVIIPRKLGAPGNPEFAIGAVTEDGSMVLDDSVVAYLGVSRGYVEEESERQRSEIARRMTLYREGAPATEVRGKDVIVVDDGIATGSTMKAALLSVKNGGRKALPWLCLLVHPAPYRNSRVYLTGWFVFTCRSTLRLSGNSTRTLAKQATMKSLGS